MSSIKMKTVAGTDKGSVDLPESIFGVEPNVAVMHQVVTAQLAAARAGTQSTKTRAEVRGGGAKPWRQKGTGRARQGSIRAPHWRGGGVAHGPKPRSYKQKTPKKMVRLALIGALSDRASESKLLVVDEWSWQTPRTKDALGALTSLGVHTPGQRDPRVLLVLDRVDEIAWKSFRNLGDRVRIILPEELNTYDVLVSDWLIFTRATLDTTVARLLPAAGPLAADVDATSDDTTTDTEVGKGEDA
jgi:large subunit ribosomal protein L4